MMYPYARGWSCPYENGVYIPGMAGDYIPIVKNPIIVVGHPVKIVP
jgi:hypothetical protein